MKKLKRNSMKFHTRTQRGKKTYPVVLHYYGVMKMYGRNCNNSSDCSSTIGGETSGESNVNGKVVEALSGNQVLSPRDTNLEIFVVRIDKSFVSDSNPNYIEVHFLFDMLPFGRSGKGETRRIKSFNKALYTSLHAQSQHKRFQKVNFVLHMWDMMVTR